MVPTAGSAINRIAINRIAINKIATNKIAINRIARRRAPKRVRDDGDGLAANLPSALIHLPTCLRT